MDNIEFCSKYCFFGTKNHYSSEWNKHWKTNVHKKKVAEVHPDLNHDNLERFVFEVENQDIEYELNVIVIIF
jgi:hypothetical protein